MTISRIQRLIHTLAQVDLHETWGDEDSVNMIGLFALKSLTSEGVVYAAVRGLRLEAFGVKKRSGAGSRDSTLLGNEIIVTGNERAKLVYN